MFAALRTGLLSVFAVSWMTTALADDQTSATAAGLISHAQRAIGEVVRAARSQPELAADRAEAKPFWKAMKELNESVDKAETGLLLKDDTFFTNLAAARAEAAQAQVALLMSGADAPQLDADLENLFSIVVQLDDNYSKEAARFKQGGQLTREEGRQLDELKKQQKDLMAKLDQVERTAAKNNKEMQEGIRKIREESRKISNARRNVSGFVGGFIASRMMSSWLWGWHWWWGPWGAWCPGWIDINIIIWDSWIDIVPYDWALIDTAVDIADLDLTFADISDADLQAADEFLIDGNFGLDDDDFGAITSELDLGWDDVESQVGWDIMDQMESNFDEVPFDDGIELHRFDDYGMDDFGFDDSGFDDSGFDDFGFDDFDLDW